jgi:hypothetical protein
LFLSGISLVPIKLSQLDGTKHHYRTLKVRSKMFMHIFPSPEFQKKLLFLKVE